MPAASVEYRNCPATLLRRLHRSVIELVRHCIVGRVNMGRMQGGIFC